MAFLSVFSHYRVAQLMDICSLLAVFRALWRLLSIRAYHRGESSANHQQGKLSTVIALSDVNGVYISHGASVICSTIPLWLSEIGVESINYL